METPSKFKPTIESIINFVTWFEIPATSFERAVEFYNSIYNINMDTNTMGGYSMAYFPSEKGITGAIISGEGSEPCDKGPLVYLNGGKDLDVVLSRVQDAGGRVLMQKQLINEELGYFALFIDSEGNRLALHSKS